MSKEETLGYGQKGGVSQSPGHLDFVQAHLAYLC